MEVESRARNGTRARLLLKDSIEGLMIMAKKTAAKRELIDTGRDKRYVRRDAQGQFKESDDVGRSLSRDRKTKAQTKSKAGQGDKGDRKR
jgi:hypothetical protein